MGSEQPVSYYDRIYAVGYSTERYLALYEAIGAWVGDRTLLDIGCGIGDLAPHVQNYRGFDGSVVAIEQAKARRRNVWCGDLYDAMNYEPADCYAIVEVLEHLEGDLEVLSMLSSSSPVVVTVPTFVDPGHVRTYTEASFKARYADLLNIESLRWFCMDKGRWTKTDTECHPGILMATGTRTGVFLPKGSGEGGRR